MASTTYTSTLVGRSGVSARAVHAGLNAVSVEWSSTGVLSASGVVLLCKLPAGARIHDFFEHHSTGATTSTIDLGVSDSSGSHSYSAIASALVQAQFNHRRNAAPAQDSYVIPEGSGAERFVTASLGAGTATTSLKLSLTILYSLDAEHG